MSLWNCTVCPKAFTRKGDLTRHKLTHTGIKPHICETCGKGFAQLSGLKTHRNVHSKAKPYICGIGTCAKAFGDPSSRTRHRKETHMREGTYKCMFTDCGTRIKRRSAFVAHLRKHGVDPNLLDLHTVVVQSSDRGIPPPSHLASSDVDDKSHHKSESRSVSPSSLLGSGYYALGDGSKASHLTDISGWPSDNPLYCRRVNWTLEDDALLLDTMFDKTVNVGLCNSHDIYAHMFSDLENPFYFDNMLSTPIDYPLLVATHSNLPTLEPFLEVRSDGSQSSCPSPPSVHPALTHTESQVSYCPI